MTDVRIPQFFTLVLQSAPISGKTMKFFSEDFFVFIQTLKIFFRVLKHYGTHGVSIRGNTCASTAPLRMGVRT